MASFPERQPNLNHPTNPSGLTQRLFQKPTVKSKFLAIFSLTKNIQPPKPMKSKLPLALGLIVLSGPLAHSQTTLYWGGARTSAGALPTDTTATPSYNGPWDTTTTNWATSASGTTYQAWAADSTAYFGYRTVSANATVTLANDMSLRGLIYNTTPINHLLEITSASARVITASPDSSNIFTVNLVRGDPFGSAAPLILRSNVALAGAVGTTLHKTGAGSLQIESASNNFLGSVIGDLGSMVITGSGSFNGSTSFTLGAAPLNPAVTSYGGNNTSPFTLQVFAPTVGPRNQLNDSANINLDYGNFRYEGFSTATQASSESIGKITLASHGQLILTNTSNNSLSNTTRPTLTLMDATSGIDRGTSGLGTMIVAVDNTNQVPTTNLVVTNFATKGVLLPWITTSRGEFMQVNSGTNVLERIASTDAPTDLAAWVAGVGPGNNYRVGGNNGPFTPDVGSAIPTLTINSLGIMTGSGTGNIAIGAGNTLTLASGGLAFQGAGGAPSRILSGGSLTSGTDKLYISGGTSNGSGFTINSSITGTLDVIVSSMTGVTLTPTGTNVSNTYTGTTYVNGGHLSANGTGTNVAIPGDLVIRSNGSASLNGTLGQALGKNITIDNGGLLRLAGNATFSGVVTNNGGNISMAQNALQTFSNAGTGLVFNGGAITTPGVHSSNFPALALLTNVSYAASSTTQATFNRIGGSTNVITLNTGASAGNAQRTFDVANSSTLADGVAEMVVDTVLANGGTLTTTGSIRKTGAGTLRLTDANTYTGGTFVAAGTLELGTLVGAAQSGLTATATSAANAGGSILTFSQRGVTDTMIIGQAVSGTNLAVGRTIAGILNDYQVVLNGPAGLSGHGSLASNVSTDVAVSALTRTGSLAAGPLTVGGTGSSGTPTLAGGGVISSSTTIAAAAGGGVVGTHAVGIVGVNNGVGIQTFTNTLAYGTGSIFEWNLRAASTLDLGVLADGATGSYDQVVANGSAGSVTGNGAMFSILLGGNVFTDAYWNSGMTWTNIFSGSGAPSNLASIFGGGFSGAGIDSAGLVSGEGQFSFNNSSTLTWTVIPEPTSGALVGLSIAAALLRRRRR